MNRFAHALEAAYAPHLVPLVDLAHRFALAVDQVIAEELDPSNDPAVLVLGSFIAFHTHADVNSASGYHQLLGMCPDRFATTPELQ
jgi:hypothetical protein